MEKHFGLLETEIRLVKKDEEFAKQICETRGWNKGKTQSVLNMLRYNVFTIQQMADLAGKDVSTINNMTKVREIDGNLDTQLDYCFPYKSMDTKGPKMIVRNRKSMALLPAIKTES